MLDICDPSCLHTGDQTFNDMVQAAPAFPPYGEALAFALEDNLRSWGLA